MFKADTPTQFAYGPRSGPLSGLRPRFNAFLTTDQRPIVKARVSVRDADAHFFRWKPLLSKSRSGRAAWRRAKGHEAGTRAGLRRPSSLVIRNVIAAGVRTSIRLEPQMWDALGDIAHVEGRSINELITTVARKDLASSLTSAIRVFIVAYYRANSMRGAGEPAKPFGAAAKLTGNGDRGPH